MNDPYNSAVVEVLDPDWEPKDEDITVTGRFRRALVANHDGVQPDRNLNQEPSGFYRAITEQDFAATEMRVLAHLEGSGHLEPSDGDVPAKRSMGELYGRGTQTGRISGTVMNESNSTERKRK